MKTLKTDVKSQSKVVGSVEYYVFDSTTEAVATLGEPEVLSLVNSQHRTNKMNAERAEKAGKPSKEALRMKAMSMMTREDFDSCANDGAKIQAWIAAKVKELEGLQAPALLDENDADDAA